MWPLEFTAAESLVQVNFWLLATIFGVGSSCAILFLNNAGRHLGLIGSPPILCTHPIQQHVQSVNGPVRRRRS